MQRRRLISFILLLAMALGVMPATTQAEYFLLDVMIQYDTGLVDGEGQPLYETLGEDKAIIRLLSDNAGVWIQMLEGFPDGPVRVLAFVNNNGVQETIPIVDNFGSEWITLVASEIPSYYRLMGDGMLQMETAIIASNRSPEEAGAVVDGVYMGDNWNSFPGGNGEDILYPSGESYFDGEGDIGPTEETYEDYPQNEETYGDYFPTEQNYESDYPTEDTGDNNGEWVEPTTEWMEPTTEWVEPTTEWMEPTTEAPLGDPEIYSAGYGENIPSTRSMIMTQSVLNSSDVLDPYQDKPDSPTYTNPFGKTARGTTLYRYINGVFEAITDLEGDAHFIVKQNQTGPDEYTLDYLHDSQNGNRVMISVTAWDDGDLTGYIPATDFVFMSAEEEDNFRIMNREKPDPNRESNYGRVTTANAVVYSAAINGTFVSYVYNGQTLIYDTSREPDYDEKHQLWLPVRSYDHSIVGYLIHTAFEFGDKDAEKRYINSIKEPLPDNHENGYGLVIGSKAVIYTADGVATNQSLPYNTVIVSDNTKDPIYNDSWKLQYMAFTTEDGSVSGYLKTGDFRFMTSTEVENHKNKEEPTEPITEPPTEPPTEPITEAPTQADPTLTPGVSRYGYVLADNVIVRAGASSSTTKTYTAKKGEVVLATNEVKGSDGYTYYYVDLVERTGVPSGYIMKQYVDLMSPQEEARYIASKSNNNSNNDTKPTTTTRISGYYRVSATYALMVPFADVGASPSAVLNRGDVVYVYEQEYDSSGNNLYHYAYHSGLNRWAYIIASSLTAMTPQEVNNHFNNKTPATPASAPTSSTTAFSGYAVLTSGGVNFRTGATTNSTSQKRLSQGTLVRVLGQTQSEGYTWYQCESGGTTGYIRGDLISLLTVAQYQSLVTSPSYNQNGTIVTPTSTAKNSGSITTGTWNSSGANASQTITFVTIPPASTASPSPSPDPNASPTVDPSASVSPDPSASGGILGNVSPSPDPDATLFPPDPNASFPTEETSGFSPPGLLIALIVLLVLVAGGMYGYSVYNKARRKQSQEQAKRLAEENRRKAQGENGTKPAVRRPVPPTTAPGTPAKPGTNGAPGAPAKPGANGAQPAKPGMPGTQAKPGTPAGSSAANPYMRPQGSTPPQARVQDVTSPLPRAQVDGKPVEAKPAGSAPSGTQPGAAGTKPPAPAKPATTASQPQNPYARPKAPTPQRSHMPVAPAPVEPDHDEPAAPTPRRRRRQQDGAKPDAAPKDEA